MLKFKKLTIYLLVFIISFNSVFAFNFDFWNSSFWNFLFGESTSTNVTVETPRTFKQSVVTSPFKASTSTKLVVSSTTTEENDDYDYFDLLKTQNKQKEVQAKMKLLMVQTGVKSNIDETCNFDTDSENIKCKTDLFVGCGDSLYLGYEMAPECSQFSTENYLKFIEIKKYQEDAKIDSTDILKTDMGEIHIIENEFSKLSDSKNTINSSSINSDLEVKSKEVQIEERKIIEPIKPITTNYVIKWNKNAYSNFSGWVTGWGTLFAINGGKKEAGQVMNNYTAFGYNPYVASTCIVSLPYKTIDKFFGTTLNTCVKTKNTACVLKIKSQIKDRAIEVVMIKNGKRAVFPLGDFGPAEWTGNAVDFTACARNVLGATGKDLVKFRPL